jgi:hypothetical protein
MKCHVGPSDEAGTPQVVDHDLIAAGHPRLAFEFHSYFESKPAHWNRHTIEALQPGEFHFRSWLAGQTAQAEQQRKLVPESGVADFSQLDCVACHHALAANSWRQKSQAEILKVADQPGIRLPNASESWPASARLGLMNQLLVNEQRDASWDGALQCYLAVRAVLADFNSAGNSNAAEVASLMSAVANLGSYLAKDCFSAATSENRWPTPYDSPTEFSPGHLAQRLQPVRDAVQRLEARLAAP